LKYKIYHGSWLFSEGKYLEARQIFSEVYQLEYECKSPADLAAASSMSMIAECDLKIDRKVEALKSFEFELAIPKSELGETHPKTIGALNRVNEVKSELGIL